MGELHDMNDNKISVVILTYNASYDDLKKTIDSVLKQKGVEIEIVLSDDGSTEYCLDKIKTYLNGREFINYKIIVNEKNEGTVKNLYRGLQCASNKYIKDISPGDMLFGDFSLSEWLEYTIEKKADWSFCDTIYYKYDKEKIIPLSVKSSPQNIRVYEGNNFDEMRWQYFVLDDISVGASMLFKKDVIHKSTEEIINKVKYAEDNAFRMAMFDGVPFCFYNRHCVLYEYGTGISTSKQLKWARLLENDFNATNQILNQRDVMDDFQRKMLNSVQVLAGNNKLRKIFVKGYLKYRIHKMFWTRKSIAHLPGECSGNNLKEK